MISRSKKILDPLQDSIQALSDKSDAIHIIKLRFPNFRNLKHNASLPFVFPITVILGKNGTNKSSILHALYGAPHKNTVGDFWFETKIDAIPQTRDGLKQSVVHSYLKDGQLVDCIKARAPRRESDPDYWEAVKPTQAYGFLPKAVREPPISLEVIHLDFRGELPAFDKYFYFPDQAHLRQRAKAAKGVKVLRRGYRKQDYLRRRSPLLKKKIEREGVSLTTNEIELLNYILEQNYLSGKVYEHNLFHGHSGTTIVFQTPTFPGYSDAFAGSGESAATLLVHKILRAPSNSLILLDEPETSLHPGAQQRLLEFLCHFSVRKTLQVVMATHSIYLAQGLPQRAIRVLEKDPNGVIDISTTYSAAEALHEIGSFPHGKTILVEDDRAQRIVLDALSHSSSKAKNEIHVLVRPGGTSRIFKDIQAHARIKRKNVFIFLDGDHKPEKPIPKKSELPQGKSQLDRLIKELTKGNNRKGPKLDFVDENEMTFFVEYFRTNVFFLPKQTPEQLVWSDDVAENLLKSDLPQSLKSESNYKERIKQLAEILHCDQDFIFKAMLFNFLRSNDVNKQDFMKNLERIRGAK